MEVIQSQVSKDIQQVSQIRSESTSQRKSKNMIEARSKNEDSEGKRTTTKPETLEQSFLTEIVCSSERGGTDTDAHSDLQTNKSTTSTVFKGEKLKRTWGSAFSPNEYAQSRITCDSDSCSAMGLDDLDTISVNGSEMFSYGSAISPLLPKQLQFASEREHLFKLSSSRQKKTKSVQGESDSEGDGIDSGFCHDDKSEVTIFSLNHSNFLFW